MQSGDIIWLYGPDDADPRCAEFIRRRGNYFDLIEPRGSRNGRRTFTILTGTPKAPKVFATEREALSAMILDWTISLSRLETEARLLRGDVGRLKYKLREMEDGRR